MPKSHLRLVAPAIVNRTVTRPKRRPNADLRTREHLTEGEQPPRATVGDTGMRR